MTGSNDGGFILKLQRREFRRSLVRLFQPVAAVLSVDTMADAGISDGNERLLRAGEELNLGQASAAIGDSRDEVKTLRGILPICMDCHKIRTDRENWQRLEQDNSSYPQADSTHRLCPDGEKKHFPGCAGPVVKG